MTSLSVASASALKKLVSRPRGSAGRRVTAKANTPVKMISGKIWSLAPAKTGLVGTIERRKSAKGGTGPAGSTVVRASRSAAADSAGIGAIARKSGVRIAPITAENAMMATIQASARPATAPALAAAAVCAIPVTSSATSSGTIVIRRPFSQSVPIGSATFAAPAAKPGTQAKAVMPSASPAPSARRIRVA